MTIIIQVEPGDQPHLSGLIGKPEKSKMHRTAKQKGFDNFVMLDLTSLL
jgi:hypothetical protein